MGYRIARLDDILNEGESQHLELKAIVPAPDVLAREMAAFANADGGTIALGIDEGLTRISGVPGGRARNHYERARRLLNPEPETQLYEVPSLRGTVTCIDVARSKAGPVLVGGVILIRDGARTRPMSAGELSPLMLPASPKREDQEPGVPSQSRIAEMLAEQSAKLDEIYQGQLDARTWRRRLPDIVVSGILGAVLGVALSAVLLR